MKSLYTALVFRQSNSLYQYEETSYFQYVTTLIITSTHRCKLEDDINISVHSFPLSIIINGIIAPSGVVRVFFIRS